MTRGQKGRLAGVAERPQAGPRPRRLHVTPESQAAPLLVEDRGPGASLTKAVGRADAAQQGRCEDEGERRWTSTDTPHLGGTTHTCASTCVKTASQEASGNGGGACAQSHPRPSL